MRTLTSETVKDKKVIIRLDLDVPIENNTVKDTTRLEAVVPSLQLLVENAKQIIIIGHLGRPEGRENPKYTLKPVSEALSKILNHEIEFIHSLQTPAESTSQIIMLENVRFDPGEEKNDEAFAQKLASNGDLFIFEAFAVSHRKAASTVGITKFLPSYAGLRIAKEVQELSAVLQNPEHPFLVILGGAKIETKLPMIHKMQDIADTIFVGGKLPKEIIEQDIILKSNTLPATMNDSGLDINIDSQNRIKEIISQAKLIVWNGPLGKFEDESAREGTKAIAYALAHASAKTVIGGGETIEAAKMFKVLDKIDFVSVGGGAMLEFLSGKPLPALESLH